VILDTNAISDFAEAHPGLMAHLNDPFAEIFLPVVALGEYRYGLKSSRERVRLEQWLDGLEMSCEVLNVTPEVSKAYAEIRNELRLAGKPIPANDLWIAAIARQNRLPVLSQDAHVDYVKDLKRIGW